MRGKILKSVLLLFLIFFASTAFASGPAASNVFLFCTLKNTADLIDYRGIHSFSSDEVFIRLNEKIGTPFHLGNSQMDTHNSPLGTVKYRYNHFNDYELKENEIVRITIKRVKKDGNK